MLDLSLFRTSASVSSSRQLASSCMLWPVAGLVVSVSLSCVGPSSSKTRAFEGVFLDICQRMEAVDTGGGQTLLDDSLVVGSPESGPITHETQSMPIITAGSAGGALSTGHYVDYRDLESAWDIDGFHEQGVPGLPFNQWLGTVQQAMGVDPAEYELVFTGDEQGGDGPAHVGNWYGSTDDGAIVAAGEPLPIPT